MLYNYQTLPHARDYEQLMRARAEDATTMLQGGFKLENIYSPHELAALVEYLLRQAPAPQRRETTR